jgi:hypothetical protein
MKAEPEFKLVLEKWGSEKAVYAFLKKEFDRINRAAFGGSLEMPVLQIEPTELNSTGSRIRRAKNSPKRGPFWDHFSWYIIPEPILRHDIEAFLLLPWYLRGLNKQSGKFLNAGKHSQTNDEPDAISCRRPDEKV